MADPSEESNFPTSDGSGGAGQDTPLEKILNRFRTRLGEIKDDAERVRELFAETTTAVEDFRSADKEIEAVVEDYAGEHSALSEALQEVRLYVEKKGPFVDGLAGENKEEWGRKRDEYDSQLELARQEVQRKVKLLEEAKAGVLSHKGKLASKMTELKSLKSQKATVQSDLKQLKDLRGRVENQEDAKDYSAMWFWMRELEELLTQAGPRLLPTNTVREQLYSLWDEISACQMELPGKERAAKGAADELQEAEKELKEKTTKRVQNILERIRPSESSQG